MVNELNGVEVGKFVIVQVDRMGKSRAGFVSKYSSTDQIIARKIGKYP